MALRSRCRHGTTIDFVQVHASLADGISVLGGVPNLKHVVLTANSDDSFAYSEGYHGKVQFMIVQHDPLDSDKGIEGENLDANHDAPPRSTPAMYNVTMVGKPDPASTAGTPGNNSVAAINIRRGTRPHFFNFLIQNWKAVLDVDDASDVCRFRDSTGFELKNSIFAANLNLADSDGGDPAGCAGGEANVITSQSTDSVLVASPLLSSTDFTVPDWRPAFGTAAAGAVPPSDGFFDAGSYVCRGGSAGGRYAGTTFPGTQAGRADGQVLPSGPTRHLFALIGPGVSGTQFKTDSAYAAGAVVNYSFSTTLGYQNLLVVLDDSLVPTSGSFVMSDDRRLEVVADRTESPPPANDSLVVAIAELLTSSSPASAYQAFLETAASLSDAVGEVEAERRIRLAALVAIDPVADSHGSSKTPRFACVPRIQRSWRYVGRRPVSRATTSYGRPHAQRDPGSWRDVRCSRLFVRADVRRFRQWH